MHRSMLLALVMLAAAGAAGAQGARLTAAEARAELFGVELAGVHEGAGDAWRECIEPSGRTLYTRFGQVREGRLEIRADGQACFIYADQSSWSCFDVVREGENYRFGQFVTRVVRRDVSACEAGADAFVRYGAAL